MSNVHTTQIILPWNDFFKKEIYVIIKKNWNACILENMQHILEQYFNCQIQLHENGSGGTGTRNLETIQT